MKPTEKIDLCKVHKQDYAAPKKPVLIDIKPASYLCINGEGEPGEAVFSDRIGALYGVAFTIKMTRKFAGKGDYAISKLEAQWFGANGDDFTGLPKDQWRWKIFIRTPDFVTSEDLAQAIATLEKKGKAPSAKDVKLECLHEGLCVQMLHVGPYDREGETCALMQAYAQREGYAFGGRHHEIYLSDPRRVAPEKIKTILRMPVKKA